MSYVGQFERLLLQACSVDRVDVMGAAFVTICVGERYLGLTNGLGRQLH